MNRRGRLRAGAAALLFLADPQEELQHHIAVVRQLPLEGIDAFQPGGVFLVAGKPGQPFPDGLLQPAAVQEGKIPGLRQHLEKPPQKGIAPLLLRGQGR